MFNLFGKIDAKALVPVALIALIGFGIWLAYQYASQQQPANAASSAATAPYDQAIELAQLASLGLFNGAPASPVASGTGTTAPAGASNTAAAPTAPPATGSTTT